ncbi:MULTISPECIES: hypothetical protein [unclassified Leucobacter]|uniref:hypothetical protein n=1 Tax=unclassified Leucobacter TaxID=2621730 RepID=UPI000621BC2D|nr:hypothetical protein [Leucobacter sp. Ag1]KKI18453.1 hypothetical protein XM48_11295 [Leucobacter sp. Ag1]
MHGSTERISRRGLLAASALAVLPLLGCAPESGTPRSGSATASPRPTPDRSATELPAPARRALLLASLAHEDAVAVIDPAVEGEAGITRIRVGAAPWGVGVSPDGGTGYAATAEGLAVIDLRTAKRSALVPYQHPAPRIGSGEYRPGGLGLAVSPDGTRVFVAVGTDEPRAHLEVFDTASGRFAGSARVGGRPFDVLVAPDGSWAATVDHDTFSVTVVDVRTLAAQEHRIAPFGTEGGLASWEKPHYGAVDADGTILLPVQGKTVVRLDPRSGRTGNALRSRANSHAHGTVRDGRLLVTVGTGAFGNATGEPNLSVLDLDSGAERVAPLPVPHETVTVWRDAEDEAWAAVAGGNTREAGWDGNTHVRLRDLRQRRQPVPGYPQAVVAFAAR